MITKPIGEGINYACRGNSQSFTARVAFHGPEFPILFPDRDDTRDFGQRRRNRAAKLGFERLRSHKFCDREPDLSPSVDPLRRSNTANIGLV